MVGSVEGLQVAVGLITILIAYIILSVYLITVSIKHFWDSREKHDKGQ